MRNDPVLEDSSANETEQQRAIRVEIDALDAKLRQLDECRAAIADEARAAIREPCERFYEVDAEIGKLLKERSSLATTYHREYPINVGDVVAYAVRDIGFDVVQVRCRVVDMWRGCIAIEGCEDSPLAEEGIAIVPPHECYRLQKPGFGPRPVLRAVPCCEETIELVVEDAEPF
jgi:hypothetical protein